MVGGRGDGGWARSVEGCTTATQSARDAAAGGVALAQPRREVATGLGDDGRHGGEEEIRRT